MMQKAVLFLVSMLTMISVMAPAARAETVNNFVITSYDIEYQLGQDEANRSTLATTEKIVADFTQRNQNHGIERAIPTDYDGHSTSLDIRSVTDQSGEKWQYSTYSDSGSTVLQIGDADSYVYGQQTFVIEYT